MVHFNKDITQTEPDADELKNDPCQHAFVIVGDKTLFAVHMTQFHDELHKYQLVFEIDIGDSLKGFQKIRKQYPEAALFFCNGDPHKDHFSIPSIPSGKSKKLNGNIFVGLRLPLPKVMPEHFFPWNLTRCKPAVADVEVRVKRIVLYRLFAHHERLPPYATYFLFGKGDEAHLTNKQIGTLASGKFDARAYGPDVDTVLSLAARPDWLVDDNLLEAGIVVSVADNPNYDPDTGKPKIPCEPRFKKDHTYNVLYRGLSPARPVVAGPTFMNCSAVINSPTLVPCSGEEMWGIMDMPKKYWNSKED